MNDNIDLKTVDSLDTSPFKKMIMTIGELPTSFVESMTYYELLTWFCNYLENTVIPTVNNNAEAVEELQTQYITLHNYVANYFNNLNVQEEINNKLDNMAEDGSLTELIKRYVDPIYEAFEQEITTTMDDNFTNQNVRITSVENLVDAAISGTPLVASSTAGMTDTERIYVNSTDGHWYYYNGSAWTDGGVYQATAIDDNSVDGENLTESLQKSVNYEEPTLAYTSGSYVTHNGTISPNQNGYMSPAISLKKGDTLVFTAKGYNTNVSLLSSYASTTKAIPIVVCSNSNVVTTTYVATKDDLYYISSLNQEPSDVKIYHQNITNIIDTVKMNYINNTIISESNSTDFIDGKFIDYRNGNESSQNRKQVTDFIEILPNSKLELRSKGGLLYNDTDLTGLAFYNDSETFISGVQYTPTNNDIVLTPPSTAKYIRLTVTEAMLNVGFTLSYCDVSSTIAHLLSKDDGADFNVQRTVGLTDNAVFIGDSLTWGAYFTRSGHSDRNYYNYPYFLKKLMQINTITEIAKGGATASSWWELYADQITQDNSIYFVWLGTNSTFTDTIDTDCVGNDYTQYASTETGCMGKILQKINSLPNNKIILLNCFASNGHVAQTNEMLAKFAERFDVTLLIDVDNTDIRDSKYHTAYNGYYNAVHFNEKGNNYVANIVNNQFNTWLGNNQFEMIKLHD